MERVVEICAALRSYRIRRRIRQASIASALGVTQSQVSRWESGRDLPRPHNLEAIKSLLWGEEIAPQHSLIHFVEHSGLPIVLFDPEHRPMAMGKPFQQPDNPLLRHGWALDPARNPAFASAYAECRAVLANPRGIIGLQVRVPFVHAGQPWRAEAHKTLYPIAGKWGFIAELHFRELAPGAPLTPASVRQIRPREAAALTA